MKRFVTLALLAGFATLCATPALAANAQQDKMKACNAQAVDKKGDDRKAFMKTCLAAAPAKADTSKMSQCNTASKGKSGDERKTFMSDCMKKAA